MKKRRVWAASPYYLIITAAMVVMTFISYFTASRSVFYLFAALTLVSGGVVLITVIRFRSYAQTVLRSAFKSFDRDQESYLSKLSFPVAITGKYDELVWGNSLFKEMLCENKDCVGESITAFTSGVRLQDIVKGNGTNITHNGLKYTVYAVKLRTSCILYFIEDTYFKDTVREFLDSRPAVATIMFDNREELLKDASDGQGTQLVAMVEKTLQKWVSSTSGFYKKLSGGRYLMVMEERHLRRFVEEKFRILDAIRNIKLDEHRYATISIGVGRGGKSLAEDENWSRKALDMALGRGGDQVAIKNGNTFEFFGGVSKGVERHDKVRSRVIALTLADNIKNSDCVFVMGHQFSDLDSVGASIGLWSAITTGQEKPCYVVLNREQTLAGALVETVEKAGNTGMFLSPREALSLITDRSLLIIVDTHSESFVESRDLYKYSKRTVVIDHHRMMVKHIENAIIFYHEPYASSASEMVTELVQYLGENAIGRLEADALLAGITLDTKNFVLKTGVRTFEAAAFLRRKGADTVEVKRLFSNSIDTYRAKYQLVSNAEIYNSCAVTAADEDCPDIRIASAQAADELLGVQGVNASFVLYSSAGTVNISARSLGAVNVQVVMEKLGGGGHQTMAGAQLKDTTVTAVRERLIEILNETQIHKENL